MSTNSVITRLLKVVENEVGYLEKNTLANLDSKIVNAGSNNYTKYWRDIKPSYQGEPWCACFVTWTLQQVVGKSMAAKLLRHYPYVYCPTLAELFTLNANPQVGDIVIFKRNGVFVHTGWVTKVSGDYFETIEGNTSGGQDIVANGGGVFKKSYYNSNLPGTKFVRLDFAMADDSSPHWGEVYRNALINRGIITDVNYWSDYDAPVLKSQACALIDKLTGGMWTSEESDASTHWVQPVIISLCGKRIIFDKSSWLSNPDVPISKALLLALVDNATGGICEAYKCRKTDHWGRNHLDSLCDKQIINTPSAWTDFEAQSSRAATVALMCKAFGI